MIRNLKEFIDVLKREGDLREISVPVDPNLEAAEIHRRIIAEQGPALLFTDIKGASYPLVTNLFGTAKRVELAFGKDPKKIVEGIAKLPEELMPPSLGNIWKQRSLLKRLLSVGLKSGAVSYTKKLIETDLTKLPLLKTWEEDGGEFVTLPLVYTEHPDTHIHNLGMYRMQRYDETSTGLHCQIGKGGGFHLAVAKERDQKLPVNVTIGGPPALILSAIAPLPENVPELLLASLVMGGKLRLSKHPKSPYPIIDGSEFVLIGECDPNEMQPEGPFGDHYGYYSLQHDYPVFRCSSILAAKDPICAATVVGKPRQEDFFLGDFLQDLLSPVFPLVMPTVTDLWSYGETGYHSLSAAVVKQRYKRESMVSAFRILGEGQLSLTKFLLLLDRPCDLKDFKAVLEYVLARADFRTDLYVFSHLSMDTLDYAGPEVNKGSKGVLIGAGEPIRVLRKEYTGPCPRGIKKIMPFCAGCLVVEGQSYEQDKHFAQKVASLSEFNDWPLIILVDDAAKASESQMSFLWTTFTRFEPGADIYARDKSIYRNHLSYSVPVVIDARMKSWYPAELECDPDTKALVDQRWSQY